MVWCALMVVLLLTWTLHLSADAAASGLASITSININDGFSSSRQIMRTSSSRLYAVVGNSGHQYAWDGWIEVHMSDSGSTWKLASLHDQWHWESGLCAAIDSKNIIHMVSYNWDRIPYYERFTTADSPGDNHTWEGHELLEIRRGADPGRCVIAVDANDVPHVVYQLTENMKGRAYQTLYYANRVGGTWRKTAIWPKENGTHAPPALEIAIGPDNVPYILMGSRVLRGFTNDPTTFHEREVPGGYSLVIHRNGDVRIAASFNGTSVNYLHSHDMPWDSGWTLLDSGVPDKGGILVLANDIPFTVRLDREGLWLQKEFAAPRLLAGPPYDATLDTVSTRWSFYNHHIPGTVDIGMSSYSTSLGAYWWNDEDFWYLPYRTRTEASFVALPSVGFAPLTVSFMDTSIAPEGVEITSWAWDLNNDSVVDALTQHPSFTFVEPGAQSVRLVVTDSEGNVSTVLRSDYIQIMEGTDKDRDGIGDAEDNCDAVFNPGQVDLDQDGTGDACDETVDLLHTALHSVGLRTEMTAETKVSDITTVMKDRVLSQGIQLSGGKRGYDAVSFRTNIEAKRLSTITLYVHMASEAGFARQPVRIYAFTSDGQKIQAGTNLSGHMGSGWNYVDLTPLVHMMDGFGFIKFRLVVAEGSLTVTEAYYEVFVDERRIAVYPGTLDFGTIDIGRTARLQLTVLNRGIEDLSVMRILYPSEPFSVESDACTVSVLTSGASCTATLAFSPENASDQAGHLTVHSNDEDWPAVVIDLIGRGTIPKNVLKGTVKDAVNGVPLPLATISVTQNGMTTTAASRSDGSFIVNGLGPGQFSAIFDKEGFYGQTITGSLDLGQDRELAVYLVPLPALVLRIDSPADRTVVTEPFVTVSGYVSNRASVVVNAVQAPLDGDVFTAVVALVEGPNTIMVTASDEFNQTVTKHIEVTWNKIVRLSVTPHLVSFGFVRLGETKSASVTVFNVSDSILSLGAVTKPFAPFWVLHDACSGRHLLPSASCMVIVLYAPATEALAEDSLVIHSDDEHNRDMQVSLKGVGTAYVGYLLPDSGLDYCFDEAGAALVSCAGQLQQDGYYRHNPISFTLPDAGTTVDVHTGLMWQMQSDSLQHTWSEAKDLCDALTISGHSDWRLPSRFELLTLVHYGRILPSIDTSAFPETQPGPYWSSDRGLSPDGAQVAGTVRFDYGETAFAPISSNGYVRCVHGTQLQQGNFRDNFDGTYTDVENGLMWTNTIFANGTDDWATDISFAGCAIVTTAGYTDWRLPNIKELASNPRPGCLFADCFMWSSTTLYEPGTTGIYGEAFVFGEKNVSRERKTASHIFRCVRGGHHAPRDASEVVVDHTVLDFGPTELSKSSFLPLTVSNAGSEHLTVIGLDGISSPFSLESDGCIGMVLAPSASCTIVVEFLPTTEGTFSSTLALSSTDTDRPRFTVHLVGIGMPSHTVLDVTVLNEHSGIGIPGAAVSVTDSAGKLRLQHTDGIGKCEVMNLLTGSYRGLVLKEGFAAYEFEGEIAANQTVSVTVLLGPVPPLIHDVSVDEISTTSATLTWTTDQPATSKVEYGTTIAYGNVQEDASASTAHRITITNLLPATTYHFRVTSTNSYGGSASSGDNSFATAVAPFTVQTSGDYGNITVMEVNGSYDAKASDGQLNLLPRQEIAKEFVRIHQDAYDFLVVFSTFDFQMPDQTAKAFYMGVKNDTQGIGKPLFDNSSLFGSNGRLQGIIDMGNLSRLSGSLADPAFEQTLLILSHEVAHRWGVGVKFRNADGAISAELLGKDGDHWSFLLDSNASLLYGNDWRDNGDGTYTSVGKTKRFSQLDLYLMGLYDRSQVPPMLLIQSASIDPARMPEEGVTVSGTATYVAIDDIIAAEGQRVPDALASQKTFKVAFILITMPGTFIGDETGKIENIRNAWAAKFKALTGGRGSIADVSPTIAVAIASPSNGATINRPDVNVRGAFVNTTGNETGIIVNGVVASVYGNQFVAPHVPLVEGSNTLTVTATDTAGNTGSSSVTVNVVTAENYMAVRATPDSGIAPLEVTVSVDGSFGVVNPTITVDGPGTVESLPVDDPEEHRYRLSSEGMYTFTATAVGPDGTTYTDTTHVAVLNRDDLDALLKAKWEGMKSGLALGDINAAVAHFLGSSQARYRNMFTNLLSVLPSIVNNMQSIELIDVENGAAEYRIRKTEAVGEVTYYILFVLDENGLWKIQQF